ncbi:MAG: 50S ribosomal protein L13 [Candidatus Moeniiplasma glomeromycotorum]|nr:50S ribosomal protein L13 [Candidatus Moeniiplasma glomeromycotorum]MCE8168490.1 50S ribosomal protein L13 [Candidatus Moeniiplasma glomeromycotorum]MCE8169852.1 50S ribosomal protein L13 [Candidatus Moeniiplasma glomeromycotorum]
MDIATQKENEQLQKTTIPSVPESKERNWYFFDFLEDKQEKEKILQYFLANNTNKITLQGDNLLVEDNNQQIKTVPINDTQTQQIKTYLQRRFKLFLLKKDLRQKSMGRVASKIIEILRGKNRNDFLPNLDLGSSVVLTNAKHILFTGNKWERKKYRNHSGYPGGLRERTLREMLTKYPQELAFRITRGMMPKTKLGDKQLKRLYIYPASEHEQQAQEKNFIKIYL